MHFPSNRRKTPYFYPKLNKVSLISYLTKITIYSLKKRLVFLRVYSKRIFEVNSVPKTLIYLLFFFLTDFSGHNIIVNLKRKFQPSPDKSPINSLEKSHENQLVSLKRGRPRGFRVSEATKAKTSNTMKGRHLKALHKKAIKATINEKPTSHYKLNILRLILEKYLVDLGCVYVPNVRHKTNLEVLSRLEILPNPNLTKYKKTPGELMKIPASVVYDFYLEDPYKMFLVLTKEDLEPTELPVGPREVRLGKLADSLQVDVQFISAPRLFANGIEYVKFMVFETDQLYPEGEYEI